MLFSIRSPEGAPRNCGRSTKCSKQKGHATQIDKCDSKRQINTFWKTTPVYSINKQRQSLQEDFDKLQAKEDALSQKEQDVLALQRQTEELVKESGKLRECVWCILTLFNSI